jgi:hypothetical protein
VEKILSFTHQVNLQNIVAYTYKRFCSDNITIITIKVATTSVGAGMLGGHKIWTEGRMGYGYQIQLLGEGYIRLML